MRFVLYIIVFGALFGSACRSSDNGSSANQSSASVNSPTPHAVATPVHSKIDACTLLTVDDLKSVQGEVFKDAQRSDRHHSSEAGRYRRGNFDLCRAACA